MKNSFKVAFICSFFFMAIACNQVSETKETKHEKDSTAKHQCSKDMDAATQEKNRSSSISVSGEVINQLLLNIDSIKAMPVVEVNNYQVVCQSGTSLGEAKNCKGVLLKTILEKALIKQENHKDRNFYIVARATDNYMATFSWGEIFNNETGNHTYVLFEENGKPIIEKGAFVLVCTNDIKSGPRHVYWLKSIEVNRVK